MRTVTVLCANDFPHSVWDDADAAKDECRRLNAEDRETEKRFLAAKSPHRRTHYHLQEVPYHADA